MNIKLNPDSNRRAQAMMIRPEETIRSKRLTTIFFKIWGKSCLWNRLRNEVIMPRNSGYANKGKQLEMAVERQNKIYAEQGIALVQKINTAWTPIRRDGKIVSSFVKEKSTVDFRGTGRTMDFVAM